MVERVPVVVVGGGQAGLATAYHLRRRGLVPGEDVVVLDAADRPGGAWPRAWDGLRLFSPAGHSSLPGRMMPPWSDGFPPRDHVVDYLTDYEQRYDLRVRRLCRVTSVSRAGDGLLLEGPGLRLEASCAVSATGTWEQPFWPASPGRFDGLQLHAAAYRRPEDLVGRVAVVGGGNTGAQVLAEVSRVADTLWLTRDEPRLLPDDVDGRVLFETATARVRAAREGREHPGVGGLGDVVAVASVREARERGALVAHPMAQRLTPTGLAWDDGREEAVDTIVWCTGFRPALRHLAPLGVRGSGGRVAVGGPAGTRSEVEPRLWLVGYGDWCGPASATLVGVGRSARDTAAEVVAALGRA